MAQELLKLEQIDKDVKIGITRQEIVEIFQKEFARYGVAGNFILFFDLSYFMTFHARDLPYVYKQTWAANYDIGLMKDWHRLCERWFMDQTVRDDFGQKWGPIQILRKVDKVPNEGMEQIAKAILGADLRQFKFDALGIGTGGIAYPSDHGCEDEEVRIDILKDSPGGSINRDGSTIYWVANHLRTIEDNDFTECALHDHIDPAKAFCINHSFFDGYVVQHLQGLDGPSRTTTLYMCSA